MTCPCPAEAPEPLFAKLNPGNGGPGPEAVARSQRGRLMGAMLEAVGRHGYGPTTLRELVALAGVSKATFYTHFESKEACFLASFEEIVERGAREVEEAGRAGPGGRERLGATLALLARRIAAEPAAARLVLVDSPTLGAASVPARRRAAARLGALLREALGTEPGEISELRMRGIAGGLLNNAYRAVRRGEPGALAARVPELADWVLECADPSLAGAARSPGAELVARVRGAGTPARERAGESAGLPWEEPANSERSRRALSQLERLRRGAAQLAVERGYAALSIPAISAAAGVSNQTFYQHFDSTEEAFLAAFEELAQGALATSAAAHKAHDDPLLAAIAGLLALLERLAAEPLLRALALFELPAAGPETLGRAEAISELFTNFLRPGPAHEGAGGRPTDAVFEAIIGGLWAIVAVEAIEGRGESLTNLAPEMVDFVLVAYRPGGR
jgi:AcrR family transcriptional regulator